LTVNADAANSTWAIDDTPSSGTGATTDWSGNAGLFDYYRVNEIKIKFIPTFTAQGMTSATSIGYYPAYVVHDINSTTLPNTLSITDLQYENCRVMNCQRPWTYYRKMHRNVIGGMSNKGYLTTGSPVARQVIGVLFQEFSGVTTGTFTIGTVVWTYYVSAYGRR
jgi:hypothetical protein